MRDQWKLWKEELSHYLSDGLKSDFPWQYLDEFLEKASKTDRLLKFDHETVILSDIVLSNNSVIKAPSRIEGLGYVGENTVIGPYAYLRGGFLLGDHVRIGTTEIKHSIILSHSNAAHFSFIGDSVVGRHCNFGAGTKTGNLRLDEKLISVWIDGQKYETGTKKLGVIMEDNVKTGCNVVINPGTYIIEATRILPNKTWPEKKN